MLYNLKPFPELWVDPRNHCSQQGIQLSPFMSLQSGNPIIPPPLGDRTQSYLQTYPEENNSQVTTTRLSAFGCSWFGRDVEMLFLGGKAFHSHSSQKHKSVRLLLKGKNKWRQCLWFRNPDGCSGVISWRWDLRGSSRGSSRSGYR